MKTKMMKNKPAARILALLLTFILAASVPFSSVIAFAEAPESSASPAGTGSTMSSEEAFSSVIIPAADYFALSYNAFYKNLPTDPANEKQPGYRISVEPDALRLLNFVSNSTLKVDTSWIKELGVDMIPAAQFLTVTDENLAENAPTRTKKYLVPGFSTVLHVNGEEIVAADTWMDLRRRAVLTALPELVNGTVSYDIPNLLESVKKLPLPDIVTYDPMSFLNSVFNLPYEQRKLLPDPVIMENVLDAAADCMTTHYVPENTDENATLTTGPVSEPCTAFTGSVAAKDLPYILVLLQEKLDQDPDFRDALINYLDGVDQYIEANPSMQYLLSYYTNVSLYRLIMDTKLTAALMSGEWTFAEEEADNQPVSSGETESDAENAVPEPPRMQSSFFKPGIEYSIEEIRGDSKVLTDMLYDYSSGDIRLTSGRRFGSSLACLYDNGAFDIEQTVNDMIDTMDDSLSLRFTNFYDENDESDGFNFAPVEDGEELFSVHIALPEDQKSGAILLDIRELDESVITFCIGRNSLSMQGSLLIKDLIEAEAVFNQDWHAHTVSLHVNAEGESFGTFSAKGVSAMKDRDNILSLEAALNGNELATFNGTVGDNGDVDFKVMIPSSSGNDDVLLRLKGALDKETGKGRYRASYSEFYSSGTRSYPFERDSVLIETDQFVWDILEIPSGKVSITPGESILQRTNIPQNLKLVLDFDENACRIADDSCVYVSLTQIDEGVISREEVAARIRKLWDARLLSMGDNWNFAYPINRLLKAGMPADLLRDLPVTLEDYSGLLNRW